MKNHHDIICRLNFIISVSDLTYVVYCTPIVGSITCLSGYHKWLIELLRDLTESECLQTTQFTSDSFVQLEQQVLSLCNSQYVLDNYVIYPYLSDYLN